MPSFSKILLAFVAVSFVAAAPMPQLHGEGVAADALFTDTDNGIGYGVENAEDALAGDISGSKPAPATGGTRRVRRQLDKVAKGAQTLSEAAGTGATTEGTATDLVDIDGDLTNNAADIGTEVGQTEADTLENTGAAIPRK